MAKLTAKARKALPKKDFAVPLRGEGKAKRGGYPIPDESHARNALARASQFGSPKVKAEVKKAVERKFPSINVGGRKNERGGERAGRSARR